MAAEAVHAYVGMGSNVQRERSISRAVDLIRRRFPGAGFSSVYESEAIGFAGDPFYNLVAGFPTGLDAAGVSRELRDIERLCGRTRRCERFGPRTLDLDLLLHGEGVVHENGLQVPRADITEHAFVLRPLAEIAGEVVHPVLGRRIADLWSEFDRGLESLRRAPYQVEP